MSDEGIAALPPDESVAPPVSLAGDPRGADWMGLTWRSADMASPGRDDVGVYRIVGSPWGPLDYPGQGLISARWRTHAAGWAHNLAAEGGLRAPSGWAVLALAPRQLLEIENDLIASHMTVFGSPPRVQFGNPRLIGQEVALTEANFPQVET